MECIGDETECEPLPIFLHPGGRWSVMGFLITFNSFWVDPLAEMLRSCSNWTVRKESGMNVIRGCSA